MSDQEVFDIENTPRPKTLADVAGVAKSATKPEPTSPQGQKVSTYFGVGLLRPKVGETIVRRLNEPAFCGTMACRVFGYSEAPSIFDPARISTRFAGEFFGIAYDGTKLNAANGYLPGSLNDAARAAVDQGHTPFVFAGEVWCEPDQGTARRPNLIGYRFVVYDRRPRGASDALTELAVAAGLIPPPPKALPLPGEDAREIVDPETGEIRNQNPAAA